MAFDLPSISWDDFQRVIRRSSLEPLSDRSIEALYQHYLELQRWNRRLALIGPGTSDAVISRHYGEALAALPLIPEGARTAVDLGSGAGFPGLVLAAARPDLEVTLVEARERKWSFLLAAARRAALPCRCLNVRVQAPLPAELPERFDLVTMRALKLPTDVLAALAARLGPMGRMLLWVGARDPDLPPDLVPVRSVPLGGSDKRRILELRRDSG